jgi:hypothetical protein
MITTTTNLQKQDHADQESRQPQAQFSIYENLAYVSDQRFVQNSISIGSSPQADVVLDHKSIADIHALVHFEGNQAFLTNKFPNNGLRLNGRSVHLETLQHEDVIEIGPFSLKVKMDATDKTRSVAANATYSVRLVNRYDSPKEVRGAAERLGKLLKVDASKVLPLFRKEHFVLKKHLTGLEATRWQTALLKAGIFFDIQVEGSNASVASHQEDSHHVGRPGQLFLDDEDEDEEIWEAPFSLREKLSAPTAPAPRVDASRTRLQVIKTIGDSVVDAGFLDRGQKYFLNANAGRTCLVHYRRGEMSVYITPNFSGYVENSRGQTTADLDSYKTPDYLFRKNRSIYRIPLPEKGALVVTDATCQYRISSTQSLPSPHVTVAPAPSNFTWRHWAWSAGTHLFLLLCVAAYLFFQAVAPKMQGPYFVKIDPSLLKKLESVKVPPLPKKAPPPPKPEPIQVAQKVEPAKQPPVKKKRVHDRMASKPKRSNSKVAAIAPPSRHPNAGGGFGEGNIKNRNINQAGILSVLGSTSLGGPSEAMAAVTNLDAVSVPGASAKNFTVGGLKGSLGNGKIAVASGDIVQTKGSKQVLRSAGASGRGEVAALERGTTGKKQVQAMVTAKMSRTVKIEGGMSREMVKRVIDQHLEEITYCYETALMTNPSIMGRIVFEWKILMDGQVGEIRIVASNVNSHEIHGCIKSSIKSWQFPRPIGAEVIVSYPFVFDLVTF